MDSIKELKKQSITLTQQEIKELFNDLEKNRDKIARSQIKLVLHLANKYSLKYYSLTPEELISAAMLALAQAMNAYNNQHESETDFTLYCYSAIVQRFKDELRIKQIIKNSKDEETKEKYGEAKAINISDLVTGKDDDGITDFFEIYLKEENEGLGEDMERYDNLCRVIKETFVNKPKYADIVIASYGLCGFSSKLTYDEIGEIYGISRQRVQQIKAIAIDKLKNNKEFIEYLKETYFI